MSAMPKVLYATLTQDDPDEPIEVVAAEDEITLLINATSDAHDALAVGVYELKETRLMRLGATVLPKGTKKEN